jgi:23S rRNA G2069 N7-methylase RlmK/C1962 C5-methylase RlmI
MILKGILFLNSIPLSKKMFQNSLIGVKKNYFKIIKANRRSLTSNAVLLFVNCSMKVFEL